MSDVILVTGGAGYIGSHAVVELLDAGYEVVVVDNLCNSKPESLRRVQEMTGKRVHFFQADIRDGEALRQIMRRFSFTAVLHFAGLKSVPESVAEPWRYHDNNVLGSLRLFEAMAEAGIRNLVFSSSATVYGDPIAVPIREDAPLSVTNPYGASKLAVENMLGSLYRENPEAWNIVILRYFNPTGAHPGGRIGEDPNGVPGNLMPYIAQVAGGKRDSLPIYGIDYPTPDGTGVRDYIHVVDLALGHLKALEKLRGQVGLLTVNLGTGIGYSVLDMVRAFAKASGKPVPYTVHERRPGDVAACYADPGYAREVLGWRAVRDQEAMCRDLWRWQSQNPDGYGESLTAREPADISGMEPMSTAA
ncbi:MAG TPA: UDP-glucose 4-epimerase GalE [Fluviicoccus sp.]|nr:UDP-glucose 4-epimerase GalE [Fluviicoccus sp.]